MKHSTITTALVALGLLAASIVPASAQAPTTVIVPAPSASPPTVTPSPSGTTIVVPPGSTVTVQPPAPVAVGVAVKPWCSGEYRAAGGGTNFGACPGYMPR